MQRFVSEAGDEDARSRYREEEADNNATQHNHGSISSSSDDRTMIAFEPNDPENPYNWSKAGCFPCMWSKAWTNRLCRGRRLLLCSRVWSQ